jgi:hypothetical protein
MTTSALRAATAAALRGDARVRALTLHQPWPFAVCTLGKDVENRSWPAPHVNILTLIHAGKEIDKKALSQVPAHTPGLDIRGAVVAVTRIAACHTCAGQCSTWAQPGLWHLKLADTLPLKNPVPATGRQRMWIPTPKLRAAVADALTAEDAR